MSDTKSKEFTIDETREIFLKYLWGRILSNSKGDLEVQDKMEMLIFEILCTIDGATPHMPAWIIACDPHPDNKAYARKNGEDWFPEAKGKVSSEITKMIMLHDEFYRYKPNV